MTISDETACDRTKFGMKFKCSAVFPRQPDQWCDKCWNNLHKKKSAGKVKDAITGQQSDTNP